jgi:hypothetical protein
MFDKREKKNGQLEANAPLSACEGHSTSDLQGADDKLGQFLNQRI